MSGQLAKRKVRKRPEILTPYQVIKPTFITCPLCNTLVYRGSGGAPEADALPAEMYACECAAVSAEEIKDILPLTPEGWGGKVWEPAWEHAKQLDARETGLEPASSTPAEKIMKSQKEEWAGAERQAARRKEYGISLHSPLDDKHPALPHMTSEEHERYLAAAETLSKAKRDRAPLVKGTRAHTDLSERMGEAVGVITEIVSAVIDRLPAKEESHE